MFKSSLSLDPEIERRIQQLASVDEDVLITGPSGSGKSAIAQLIHERSARPSGRFVPQNCGAIPAELAESTLFGHVRGAFTTAHADAPGIVEAADKGTLFLDEIGELPLPIQAKLLTLLQERVYRPVGSVRDRPSRFRLIAATNRDLLERCNQGLFREDLYHRINVFSITLPALRDTPEQAHLIAAAAVKELGMTEELRTQVLSAVAELSRHPAAWRGNARELLNFVKRCVLGVEAEKSRTLVEWARWRSPESDARLRVSAPSVRASLADRERYGQMIHDIAGRGVRPKAAGSRRGSLALASRLLDAFPEPLSLEEVQAALGARDPRTAKANIDLLVKYGLVQMAGEGVVAVWPPWTSTVFARREGAWIPAGNGEILALASGDRLRVEIASKLAGTLSVLLVTHRPGSAPQPVVIAAGLKLLASQPRSLEIELDKTGGLEQVLLHVGLPAHRGGALVQEPMLEETIMPDAAALEHGRRMARDRWGEGWLAEHLVFHVQRK